MTGMCKANLEGINSYRDALIPLLSMHYREIICELIHIGGYRLSQFRICATLIKTSQSMGTGFAKENAPEARI
jgi:hypothetical protein